MGIESPSPSSPTSIRPSLISLVVSVDVKHHERRGTPMRVQELCESPGGRPGLSDPNKRYGLCGRKATLNQSPSILKQTGFGGTKGL